MSSNSTSTGPPSNSGGPSGNNNNILGTSPTTAVAMIILYSITGVITALFLIIIVTGAVRAHRHPERYGPRAGVNGRPRQSRAKGIARAMLDTLPIVKFGDREEPKRGGDVEMGANPGSSDQAQSTATAPANPDAEVSQGAEPSTADGSTTAVPTVVVSPQDEVTEATRATGEGSAEASKERELDHEGTLGCSICTEDFVKGEDVRVLPCDHKYHPECIDPWLLNVSGTCPLCRIDLRPAAKDTQSTAGSSEGPSRSQGGREGGEAPEGSSSNRHSRVSRFMEFHLGLTPASEPEERIAALLRLREERRHGERRRHRARDGEDGTAGGARSRSNSRRRSHLGGLFRESWRRRSSRMETPTPTPDDEGNGGAAAAAAAAGATAATATATATTVDETLEPAQAQAVRERSEPQESPPEETRQPPLPSPPPVQPSEPEPTHQASNAR